MTVDVSQGNPCPVPTAAQTVTLWFYDGAGMRYTARSSIPVDASGNWQFSVHYTVPLTAAIGQGHFGARCNAFNGDQYDYAPAMYAITGPVPSVDLPKLAYKRGETLTVTSSTPCPTPVSSVQGTFKWKPGGLSYPHAITFTLDPATGNWTGQAVIPQYYPTTTNPIPLGQYRLDVTCTGATGGRDLTYDSKTFNIGAVYVALGDSYSSGEGTFNYDSSSGNCHRSPDSYVGYVANHANLPNPVFAACSGAQTDDFYVTNPNNPAEPRQLNRLGDANPDVVTLTIGGNDADFRGVATRCANHPQNAGWGCSNDSSLNADISSHLNALAGIGTAQTSGRTVHPLLQVYRDIHAAAPAAKIYVGGYPRLFGEDKAHYITAPDAPGGATCAAPVGVTFSYQDAQWLNDKAHDLNQVIYDAVTAAKSEGIDVTFVPAALFGGHDLCDSNVQWIQDVVFNNNIPPGPAPESLHPTVDGYTGGYGVAFVAAMS